MKLTDTHCHLNLDDFDQDVEQVLNRAQAAGIEFILVPGIDVGTSQAAIDLAERFSIVYAAVGFHPNETARWNPDAAGMIQKMTAHPKVLAVGEIGLDYYRDRAEKSVQMTAFQEQLDIAAEADLPVVIHNRKAGDDLYPLLLDWQKGLSASSKEISNRPGVLHSFHESEPLFDRMVSAGFFFGIGGPVTYKNSHGLSEVVGSIPADRLLLETDAPFLTPHPHRGQRNEPAYIQLIAEKVALIRTNEEVPELTTDNAARLFAWRENIEQ